MKDADWRRAIYPALLVVFALAYLWRITGVAPIDPVSSHLSNFYLTGAAVALLSGPQAFVDPSRRRRAVAAAAVLAAVNLGGEILVAAVGWDDEVNRALGDVNTSDPVDGVIGILTAGLVVGLLPWRR